MKHILTKRKSWKEVLNEAELPLRLPVAHDSLSARIIELAGFNAYQVGGFALAAAMHAVPDVDLEKFGEKRAAIENIISSSPLPVLVDVDDGYGDAKNVTRTIHEYARIGASAIFMEDQQAPKKCGHMGNKHVISSEAMQNKVKAAVAARQNTDLFILARTDAIAVEGVDKAIDRGKAYLDAGADGIYLEGPTDIDQLEKIGKTFKGVPLATSILEGGGKTPWVSPEQMGEIGFSMILYPTTVLFQIAYTIQEAVKNLQAGQQMPAHTSVTMKKFLDIVDLPFWSDIEQKFEPSQG